MSCTLDVRLRSCRLSSHIDTMTSSTATDNIASPSVMSTCAMSIEFVLCFTSSKCLQFCASIVIYVMGVSLDQKELTGVADYVVKALPDGRFTIQSLLPVVTILVEHADDMKHLTGPEKKVLVLRALEAAARRLPPPEDTIACMLVGKLGPAAVDALVSVSRQAQVRLGSTGLFPNAPLVSQPARRPPFRFVVPWRRFDPPRAGPSVRRPSQVGAHAKLSRHMPCNLCSGMV